MEIEDIERLKSDYEALLWHPGLLGPEMTREAIRTIAELTQIIKTLKNG